MKLLICGDRAWDDKPTMKAWIKHYHTICGDNLEIIHGACEGADLMAEEIAKELEIPYHGYPARWAKHGRAAGPMRNRVMLNQAQPDQVLAFHNHIDKSRGTKNMLTQCEKRDIVNRLVKSGKKPSPEYQAGL
jgi:hypothetical protein